jgi:hypothetical protein
LGARSDQITTQILEVLEGQNFQKKKKMAGEDPLDPLLPLPPPPPQPSVGKQDDACYTNADSSPDMGMVLPSPT